MIVTGQGTGFATTVTGTGEGSAWAATTVGGRYETKTEELGTRDFEGVSAEGSRRVTTIPAGAIGNEMPIETVYERWYSKELGMVVFEEYRPALGEQTYKLTNVSSGNPIRPFSVPDEYRRFSEPGSVYESSYYSWLTAMVQKLSSTPRH